MSAHHGRATTGILALDIGGSSIKSAIIKQGMFYQDMLVQPAFPLPNRKFAAVKTSALNIIEQALKSYDIGIIGISTAGSLDKHGVVLRAGNFEGYENVDWAKIIAEDQPELQTFVVNDGRASAWAEYHHKNDPQSTLIHLVVGTGVGAGIIQNGTMLQGDQGYAGHLGHIPVSYGDDAPICNCGKQGCPEVLCSGPAMLGQWQRIEGEEQTLQALTQSARYGDQQARDIIARAGMYMGRSLGIAASIFNPTYATVGGGVLLATQGTSSEGGNLYMQSLIESLRITAHHRVQDIKITQANYGNDSGVLGAALYAGACSW